MNRHRLLLLATILFPLNSALYSQQTEEKVSQVKMGFSSLVFIDAKPQDANAAIVLWAEVLENNLLTEKGIKGKLVPYLFSSIGAIENALSNKEVDMLAITSPDYFALKNRFKLLPAIAGVIDESIYEQYVLLVRNDSGCNSLKELSGKILVQPKDLLHPLLNIWLSNSLFEINAKDKHSFFKSIRIEEKESNAVYSVFFKKADCAIVKRRLFNTICSLNPQIQKTIKILKYSSDLVLSFSAYRKDADINSVKLFYDVAKNAHLSKEGKNILKVFKSVKLVDISDKDLESTRLLIESYNNNRKKITR